MAYTKKTWEQDDTITASAMNNIENGIADVANVSTDSGSPNTAFFDTINCTVRKQGNLVVVRFEANPKANIGAWSTMATIPTGFRPQENTYFVGTFNNTFLPICITTGGAIQPLIATSGTTRLAFTVSYIVA